MIFTEVPETPEERSAWTLRHPDRSAPMRVRCDTCGKRMWITSANGHVRWHSIKGEW